MPVTPLWSEPELAQMAGNPIRAKFLKLNPSLRQMCLIHFHLGAEKAEKFSSPHSDSVGLGAKKRHYRSARNRRGCCLRGVDLEAFRGPITQGSMKPPSVVIFLHE